MVIALAGLTLIAQFGWLSWDVDQLILRTPGRFGAVRVGHMSPITAATFVLASLALLVLSREGASHWMAAALAAGVVVVGQVVILGYLYGTPLLYGGTIIPVALTTALALTVLGAGLIAASGPRWWPLRSLVGASTRARLLRAFLPVTVALVVVEGWITNVALLGFANPALTSSLAVLGTIAVISVVVSQIAYAIGGAIDRAEEVSRRLAYYDVLTGLPNRTSLHERLAQAIASSRVAGKPVALLLLDVDRFKEINDTLGHHRGDVLLQQIGPRLRHALRATDTVGRLGGDEFAVVLPLAESGHAELVARKILTALSDQFPIEAIPIIIEASIGIALAPHHGTSADELIQRADVAMYAAKEQRCGYVVYAPEHDQHSPHRLVLMGELRQAIDHGQMILFYQPKIDLRTRRIGGVEALVRWRHPERGMIPPDQFISMAERSGLIRPLTLWVLDAALAQCRAWRDAGWDLSVAVNLSARNLHDPDLPDQVTQRLRVHGVPPSLLEIEITESVIMIDPARAMEALTRLSRFGVRISIDDFGTGYSSLGYLKKLPVNQVKIDKSFIMDMEHNPDDAVIVRSTIDLAHNLSLQVVAEGVENRAILDRLAGLGCDAAQGYYIARPIPAEELSRWLGDPQPHAGAISFQPPHCRKAA